MKVLESVKLSGNPFPSPLPKSPESLVELFSREGFDFETVGHSIIYKGPYSQGCRQQIESVLSSEQLSVKVHHSVWAEFESSDYQNADLWIVRFPDLWIKDFDISYECSGCGRRCLDFQNLPEVSLPKTNRKPFESINAQAPIVHNRLVSNLSNSIRGSVFKPVSQGSDYSYFLCKTTLSELPLEETESLNYRGFCSVCSNPLFDKRWGPYRFSKETWNGLEVVRSSKYGELLFTPRASKIMFSLSDAPWQHGIGLFV